MEFQAVPEKKIKLNLDFQKLLKNLSGIPEISGNFQEDFQKELHKEFQKENFEKIKNSKEMPR